MFKQRRLETATVVRNAERTESAARTRTRTRTRRIRRPRSLAALAILIALAALTAGGPLVVVSTTPTFDPAGIPALR